MFSFVCWVTFGSVSFGFVALDLVLLSLLSYVLFRSVEIR